VLAVHTVGMICLAGQLECSAAEGSGLRVRVHVELPEVLIDFKYVD
jgi:hypothetical protein